MGHGISKQAVIPGAVVGGTAGVFLSCLLITRLKNFKDVNFRSIFIGGVIGFILAAVIAVNFLHFPFIAIASLSLAGLGALTGYIVAKSK